MIQLRLIHVWIAVIIGTLSAGAQLSSDVRLIGVDLRYVNDKIQVPYKIVNGKSSDSYVVWVEFFNEKNQLLKAKTLQGDINLIQGTGDKMITWDARADGFGLNEKLTARVNAKLIPYASTAKAIAFSTLFPGAGDYQFKKGKPYWLMGLMAYGFIGGSIGAYSISNDEYSLYKSSNLHHSKDPNYASAMRYRQVSLALAGAGIAIWLIDYAGIMSKSSKHKNIQPQSVITDPGYRLYTATSPSRNINTRSLPPNLFAYLEFMDENGNGILESRESAKLKITLSNQGSNDAVMLKVNVTFEKTDKSLKIENTSHVINVLHPNEKTEIFVPFSTDINLKTATYWIAINISDQYGFDMETAYLVLNTNAYEAPQLVVAGHEIIDAGAKIMAIKPDRQLQAGEKVKVRLVVQNIGQGNATNVDYSITTIDPDIFIDEVSGKLGNMFPGEVKEIYFTLNPSRNVTTKNKLPIFLTINDETGKGSLKNQQLSIVLDQMPPKPNIVEKVPAPESANNNSARFEFTSDRFRIKTTNVATFDNLAPSQTKRLNAVAVVIGIANYLELPPDPYADNDARIMKTCFEKLLGVKQVLQYTNEQVTVSSFEDIFNPVSGKLCKAIVKGESEVFVFYSGHVMPDKDGKNVFLFPSDGQLSQIETQGYNIEKLYRNLSQLGAKHVNVIFDACFNGVSRNSVKFPTVSLTGQKGVKVQPGNSWLTDSNFTVILSSTGGETSLGLDDSGTGLFTYFMAEGLKGSADANGDKTLTLGELKEYVVNNVKETSVKMSGQQTPLFYGNDNSVMVAY